MFTESDWRIFRDMVPALRERYLASRNVRISALLADPKKNETERFWAAMDVMEREARILRECLDGHSRSSMWLFMHLMIQYGMFTREDLSGFSEGLQQQLAEDLERKEREAMKCE